MVKILELLSLCIEDFPETLSEISKDDEDFLKCSFTALIDALNFIDQMQFYITMQENLGLLLKILGLLEKYHNLLKDPSIILKFFLELLDRTDGEKQLWSLLEIDLVFLDILKTKTKPIVIEMVIECVSLMITSNKEDSRCLFNLFNEIIFMHFQTNDLKVFFL